MRRYDGNSGRYVHVPEESMRQQRSPTQREQRPKEEHAREREVPLKTAEKQKAMPPPNQFGSGLQNVLSNIFAQGFEVEDLLLFAVLFLMYQETKDKELLIIMGGMFLL